MFAALVAAVLVVAVCGRWVTELTLMRGFLGREGDASQLSRAPPSSCLADGSILPQEGKSRIVLLFRALGGGRGEGRPLRAQDAHEHPVLVAALGEVLLALHALAAEPGLLV